MTFSRLRFVAAALAAVVIPSVASAQQEPGTVAAHATYLLDEYNIDVSGAQDSTRIAAGLGFGTAYPNGWWWTAGPRLSWVRWNVDVPQQYGFGAGGSFGFGWDPQKTASPYGAITLDRDFNVGGVFDWQTNLYFGARVKVTPDPREHFTMTFAVSYSSVFGGNGPHGGDVGIAVLYSAVLFAKHR
jgi:hypothetical protein